MHDATPRCFLDCWRSRRRLLATRQRPVLSRVEQPDYKVDKQEGWIEIRCYGPMIAAEAVVEGKRKSAINKGLR